MSSAVPQYIFEPVLYPPLGSTTVTRCEPKGKTRLQFHAVMTVANAHLPPTATGSYTIEPKFSPPIPDEHRFQVILWWSVDGRGIWRPAQFREVAPSDAHDSPQMLEAADRYQSPRRRDHFVLDFEYGGEQPLQFCLKYMFSDGPWLWEGARIGKADGRVVFIPARSQTQDLSSYPNVTEILPALPKCWDIDRVPTSNSETILFYLTTRRDNELLSLGHPARLERWIALVKIAAPWMGPTFGGKFFDCNRDAMLLFLQRRDGRVVVLLPVTGAPSLGGGTNYIVSDNENQSEVMVRSLNDDFGGEDVEKKAGVIVAMGDDANTAMNAAVGLLKRLVKVKHKKDLEDIYSSLFLSDSNEIAEASSPEGNKSEFVSTGSNSARAAWETGLSYCTWNGMGWDLSEDKLLDALKELDRSGFPVCNLLIDDNWQTLEGRNYGSSGTWTRFEANPQFPNGLKGAVSRIRARYPNIEHIGVWHALHGYWDGITPDGDLAKTYQTVQVLWRDNVKEKEKYLTMVHPSDIDRFYDDFYKFLSESGITGVKTDVQSRIDELALPEDRAFLSRPYQNALAKAGAKYFDGRVIYCMAHIPQIFYHSLLDAASVVGGEVAKVVRTSDDFYPDVPASHAWHIYANAQNMILFSRFNILPDWDMFQTTLPPPYNGLHAAARCLSGGPIFITDQPGHTSPSTIASLSAQSAYGKSRTVTLNPSSIATPLNPFMQYGEEKLCLVKNDMGRGARFLGAFNVANTKVTELVPLSSWLSGPPGNEEDQGDDNKNVLIRSYATGDIWPAANSKDFLIAELQSGAWDVFTALPLKGLTPNTKVAVLGLMDKITGAAAVKRWELAERQEHLDIEIELIALGVLGVYIADPQWELDDICAWVNVCDVRREALEKDGMVLKIDVEKEWKSIPATSVRRGKGCRVEITYSRS